MRNLNCFILIVLQLLMLLPACGGREDGGSAGGHENERIELSLEKDDYRTADSLSRLLLEKSRRSGDRLGEAQALFYLGVYTGDSVKARYVNLKKAEEAALELKDNRLLSQIYNSLGISEMAAFRRYDVAHRDFVASIKYANQAHDEELAIKAESNLSDAFRLVGDTLGIVYDKKIFDYAVGHNDRSMLISSAFHCGIHYASHSGNIDDVRKYADVLDTIKGFGHYSDYIRALWYFNRGDMAQSSAEIQKARSKAPDSQTIALLEAEILNRQKQYAASVAVLGRILAKGEPDKSDNRWIEIYRLSGSNALALGAYQRAATDLSRYTTLRDSIARELSEASMAHYKMVYEVEKKNTELTRERAKRQMMIVIIAVAGVLAAFIIGFLVWHNRGKEKLYREMVKQNRAFGEREHFYEQRISELTDELAAEKSGCEKETKSEIKANTFRQLWQRLVVEMEEKGAYRDRNLSRDSLAEALGTNHSYLTEVIKENTGLSFPQFVNGYRVREAARLLEDCGNRKTLSEIALELGFSSTAALHSSFSKAFGMSPGTYRKVARKEPDENKSGTGTPPDATPSE